MCDHSLGAPPRVLADGVAQDDRGVGRAENIFLRVGLRYLIVTDALEQGVRQGRALIVLAAQPPVRGEGREHRQRDLAVVLDGPAQGGVQVVVFDNELSQEFRLGTRPQIGLSGTHQVQVIPGMVTLRRVRLPELGDLFRGEGTNGREHAVPARVVRHLDEGFLHQTGEHVRSLVPQIAYFAGGVQVRAPGEHREPAGQAFFSLVEQTPTPLDHGSQGLVRRRRCSTPPGEQEKTVVETPGDLLRRECVQPRGGQFDGQRNAVQSPADQRDGFDVGIVYFEIRAYRGRSLVEQLDGGVAQRLSGSSVCGGKWQGDDRPQYFSRDSEDLLAGRQDSKL